MTVVNIPVQGGYYKLGYKYLAATADTLPTTNNNVGDRALIYDGDDKYWDGDSWETDTGISLGAVTVSGPLGRRSDATSASVAISTEDAALVGALAETAPANDTASSGLNGRLQRIAQNLTTIDGRVDGLETAVAALVQESSQVATTATITVTADNAANVTLLASNAARKGATFFNTSTAILYLKFGATAVIANSWTVQIPAGGYYEIPKGRGIYTGIVDGIWATDPNAGSCFATEW